jgi:hypothetical protein
MEWVGGGDQIRFSGEVVFFGTTMPAPDGDFDVRLIGTAFAIGDNHNPSGAFSMDAPVPNAAYPFGTEFEVQIVNISGTGVDASPPATDNITLRVDIAAPQVTDVVPEDDTWQDPSSTQLITITISEDADADADLTLHYWVQDSHDTNSDGFADAGEYQTAALTTNDQVDYWALIDDTNNAAGQKVSYYVSGTDVGGNTLMGGGSPGLVTDIATYGSRGASALQVTGAFTSVPIIYPGVPFTLQVNISDVNGPTDLNQITVALDGSASSILTVSHSTTNQSTWSRSSSIIVRPTSRLDYLDTFDQDYELILDLQVDWSLETLDGLNDLRITGVETQTIQFDRTVQDVLTYENDLEIIDLTVSDVSGTVTGPVPSSPATSWPVETTCCSVVRWCSRVRPMPYPRRSSRWM